MTTVPRRRWYQFSLRTIFVLVTIACAGFGYWVHWSKEWIRQRHELLQQYRLNDGKLQGQNATRAPGGLWLFGEPAITELFCYPDQEEDAQRLFPELQILFVVEDFSDHASHRD